MCIYIYIHITLHHSLVPGQHPVAPPAHELPEARHEEGPSLIMLIYTFTITFIIIIHLLLILIIVYYLLYINLYYSP